MTVSLFGKDKYVVPSILVYQFYAKGIVCTSSNSSIDDWIDDGDIFAIEESTDF